VTGVSTFTRPVTPVPITAVDCGLLGTPLFQLDGVDQGDDQSALESLEVHVEVWAAAYTDAVRQAAADAAASEMDQWILEVCFLDKAMFFS